MKPRSTDIYEAEDRLLAKDGHIAELEAKLEKEVQRGSRLRRQVEDAEAKLAMVKEWWSLVGYMNEYDCKVIDPTEGGDLERILSDTEPPLAVIEGYAEDDFSGTESYTMCQLAAAIFPHREYPDMIKIKAVMFACEEEK